MQPTRTRMSEREREREREKESAVPRGRDSGGRGNVRMSDTCSTRRKRRDESEESMSLTSLVRPVEFSIR